jgi:DNA-binding XRE family transcriptional regulator
VNAMETLVATVSSRLPKADTELVRPRNPSGRWTLDVELDGWLAVVVWIPRRGFGVTAGPLDAEPSYGENLDQAYPGSAEDVAEQVVKLVKNKKRTSPPHSVALHEIRARCGLSQADVANRLAVRQGTVSKLERNVGLDVNKLASLVNAMGGELELWVRFPDDAPVKLLPPVVSRPPTKRKRR